MTVMKVDGPRPIETVRSTRARSASGAGGAFAPAMQEDVRSAAPMAGGSPIAAVDTLIALQEMPDSMAGKARAARRGRDVLDLLDDVRDGMLAGGVSRTVLKRLVALVEEKREDFVDPGLAAVLDEIDLRARVELAKLNFAAANGPAAAGQQS
ncbi:MAG: flagellar assembly protein FliX [Alphaproteobacteria bacterium]|nr:flagellar assembly protein FliX [Alphaproteobacteria bacterium]